MSANQAPLVQVNHLQKSFGDIIALNDISLHIAPSEVVALLGENGAGKSTCINTLLGRIKADGGQISLFDGAPGELGVRQRIGVMLQSAALPDNLTVSEQLRLFASYYPNSKPLPQTMKTAMLEGLERRKIRALSGGQKQRLLFAMAIVGNPELVILDEPTVGLDVASRRKFWQCIRKLAHQGVSVLLTTHYLEEADALSDRILVLANGKIVAEGTPHAIKANLGGKYLRFRCESADDRLTEILEDTAFERSDERISITSSEPERLLKRLFEAGLEISDLTVEAISLEEAFLQLTIQNARDFQRENKEEAA